MSFHSLLEYRPAVDNNELKALFEADPRSTVRELAEELGVSHSTVMNHLKQLGKSKKLDKWVPCELVKIKEIIVPKCHLRFFSATKIILFSIAL